MPSAEKIGDLKVAIVIGSLIMGGAERMAINLGRSLHRLGHRVTLVTVTQRAEWHRLIEDYGLKSLHIEGRKTKHAYHHAYSIGKALRQGDFDAVIIVKYTGSERLTQAALNMLPDRVVAIPWIHADTEDSYRTALLNPKAWNVAVGVGLRVTEMARIRSCGRPVVHIPNGIIPPPPDAFRTARAPSDSPFRLLYVGRMAQEQKRIFMLPRILRRCADLGFTAEMVLVGDGPDYAELLSRFSADGLSDRVHARGAVSHDAVYKAYAQAHLTLVPSSWEAMPCVPIEAQLCGSVPIVSRLPGVTDTIVEHEKTGYLCPVDDVDAFSAAILSLADDRQKWEQMSWAGKNFASHFSIEAMGKSFENLIRQCLNGEYPLQGIRRQWLPVNPMAMTMRDAQPLWLKRLGIRSKFKAKNIKYLSSL